jgi:RHH-type proline utilization regulon transcriptional repressor/proline dehydrogenase/delta 1-pyrroline-5-carboxylate dehydrogenase
MDKRDIREIGAKAVVTAERWQNRADELLSHEEKEIQDQMLKLLTHPMDKVILTKMIDQSFRSSKPARVAEQVNNVLTEYGVPDFFSRVDRLLMQMFLGLGRHLPALTVPKMIEKMRHQSSRAIIDGEPQALQAHLEKRKNQGVRMNINHLGEAVLGEAECKRRIKTYIRDLENPDVEYISVKISTIYSQIHALAFEHTVEILVERLSRLYRTAAAHRFTCRDGNQVAKFVNLDMEEYRDLEITVEAFKRTLQQEAFKNYSAGLALQAYVPDSFDVQRDLTRWARERLAAGGSPIKLRIVKGANMEMEQQEAAIFNWPLAPYDNKLDCDANYKRMIVFGMKPENIRAVNLGIASHNLFELAFAYELGNHLQVRDHFYFEMLEGMADHVRRVLCELAADVLLYAPVATKDEFINAIAYLVRRLDENTAEENFLRFAPKLKPDSQAWSFLKEQFLASLERMDGAGTRPHRTQNRLTEQFTEKMGTYHENEFNNEPDTDWSPAANRRWAEEIRKEWMRSAQQPPIDIPLVIGGKELSGNRQTRDVFESSRFDAKIRVARFALADEGDIQQAVRIARMDPDGWRRKTLRQRHAVLSEVAMALRRARGDLIGAAAADTGKVFTEGDIEVSEAIDFAEYYPFSARVFDEIVSIEARGKGVGCVISPWNFPIAIPCGGITAALAAGNTVIFKPSSDAVLTAWRLCRCFWEAGVSRNALQFVPCSGGSTGKTLVSHPDVDFVILTGGTETGLQMLAERPDLFLAAETGGKNATIVTAMADRDQAVKNVLHSAFSNCGQKCSATSLLILEKEVYEDPHFKEQLIDAARSLAVGSVWDFHNKMGPLIRPPTGDLKRAMETLEEGESWALEPRMLDGNPHLWSPGIKWDVQPGSFTHLTELFGPVLGAMRAENLDGAIELVNATGYGLTSGLESLAKSEQEHWKARVRAGNLYINRGTTGAVTLRQPFGGMGKSAVGPAIKAGSPNYVAQFMDYAETGYPRIGPLEKEHPLLRIARDWQRKIDWGAFPEHSGELRKTVRGIKSYLYHWEQEFSREKDYFHLRGQDNVLRYLPVGKVVVRVHPQDSLFEVLARIAAARICGCALVVSLPEGCSGPVLDFVNGREGRRILGRHAEVRRETDAQLADAIPRIQRIRYAAPDRVPRLLYGAAAQSGFYIARSPVLMEGRLELLHYVQNQSICDTYHRYGNLGERAFIESS